jgi:GNAT superfamily N-acetyltransferase
MTVASPDSITIRPPTLDDAPAVVDLINACSVAEGGAPDMPLHRLLQGWNSGDLALGSDAWVALAPDGRIVGYEEAQIDQEDLAIELDGYVHPDFTSRGVGTRLLRLAEARARAALPGSERLRLRATIASANQAARQLFAAEGYTTIRHFWRMEIALDQPPLAPRLPTGIAVRCLARDQDERAAHSALEEAMADHWDHTPELFEDWKQAMIGRADFDPALWFLATDGDEIAGVALCFDSAEHGGWVRSLAVRPRWRRHGLGLALLHHAFGAFYARGRQLVGLAVDSQSPTGATRLYERAGMQVTEQYDTCEKTINGDAAGSLEMRD